MGSSKDGSPLEVVGALPPVPTPPSLRADAPDRAEVVCMVAGGAAHELNNVFALLLMQMDVLGEGAGAGKESDVIEGIRSGLRRGIGIADTLLQQASVVAGARIPLNPKYLLVGLQRQAKGWLGAGKDLVAHYPDHLPTVQVEPLALSAALVHLCRLAARVADSVAIKVEIPDSEEGPGSDGALVLSVSARGFSPVPAGEVTTAAPELGDVVRVIEEHDGHVTAVPAAGAILLHLPRAEGEPKAEGHRT